MKRNLYVGAAFLALLVRSAQVPRAPEKGAVEAASVQAHV